MTNQMAEDPVCLPDLLSCGAGQLTGDQPTCADRSAAAGDTRVLLELSEAQSVSSSDIAELAVAWRLAKDADADLILTGVTDSDREVLRATQLDEVMRIAESIEDGLKMLERRRYRLRLRR